jgi:hypothetical protein
MKTLDYEISHKKLDSFKIFKIHEIIRGRGMLVSGYQLGSVQV